MPGTRGDAAEAPRPLHSACCLTCSRSLTYAFRALPPILRDERLGPLLGSMAKAYMGPEYGAVDKRALETVGPDDIDGLAKTAFPLCMQSLHESLNEAHHLKHGGRQQYGLFIKGLGLSLEGALVFWQRAFSAKMSPEAFLKAYAYNIRHNYGKEGKRTDYTPYSCAKIVNGTPPGAGEAHGCPFRHWDQTHLRAALARQRLPPTAVDSVIEAVRNRDYQVACRRQFEARFPGVMPTNVGNHPNAYAEEAIRAIKAAAGGAEGAGDGAGVPPAASFSPVTAVASPGSGGGPGSPVSGRGESPVSAMSPLMMEDDDFAGADFSGMQ